MTTTPANVTPIPRKGFEWWDRFNRLPRFSFWRGGEDEKGSVIRVPDRSGAWIEDHSVGQLIDAMQSDINELKRRLDALGGDSNVES